nr:helix-turn-helix domain-containing protein [Streptomyces sp. NRRL S-495]
MAERVQVREIDEDEGRRLLRIVRRGTGSVVTWRRAQMVLLSAQRMNVAKIAEVTFTSVDRVRDVIHNFNTDGFDSLYPKYRGGRPRTFALPERREMKKIAKSKPTSGLILRRNAATHLVQRARGGSLHEAAQFLGIKVGEHGVGFGTKLGKWARAQDNLHAFGTALDAIAADLEASPRTDYQHRRRSLTNWTLPPATWDRTLAQLRRWPGNRLITDDRKRLAVSAYIWARVTQGEYFFSPCPSHIAADPAASDLWKYHRRFTCTWLRQADDHPHYRELKVLLDDHGDRLAKAIDAQRCHLHW